MKTLSKKLLSLLLVAVMLVAAMPFAAFADSTTKDFNVRVYVGMDNLVGETTTTQDAALASVDEAKAAEILNAAAGEFTKYTNTSAYTFEKATVSGTTIYIRYSVAECQHDWHVIESGKDATKHVLVCTKCQASKDEAHNFVEKGNAVAATHLADGKHSDKECTVCHYVLPGDVIPKLTEHTFANGVCACGAKQYSVTITVDGTAQNYTPVVEAGETADMTTAAGVLAKLGLTDKNYTVSYFSQSGNVISMTAAAPKEPTTPTTPTTPSAQTVKITLVSGNSTTTQTVEVGKYYSDYAAFNPAAQDGRTPESLKIESNNGTNRIVNVNTKTDNGKILGTDTKVTIQWKAADRQIRFYTDSTLGKIHKTLTVYSGKAIGELPTNVNGKAVEYWTVWGSRIYTTTTYDWTADYVDAVPHFAGETGKVYLEVYVNGNRTSKYAQVDITHKLQDGVIYRDTLLDTIRSATKNNSLKLSSVSYLFNESEWSQYVRNVNNTTTNTKLQIGTDSQNARYVYVMVNGVTTKTTDPSNPKTGDSAKLGVAAAVLAVAVVGFGAVIVINKKKGAI